MSSTGVPVSGDDTLRRAVARAASVEVRAVGDLRPASGGDVSRAFTAVVDGQRCFVKHLDPPVPGLLSAEASSLRWLADAGTATDPPAEAVPLPRVVGVADVVDGDDTHRRRVGRVADVVDGDDTHGGLAVLVLAFVEEGRPAADHDERLGRGLAAMHRAGADGFGAPWAGFVGRLPQPNDPTETWAAFLGSRRLWPTARIADERGALPPGTLEALEGLINRLPDLVGPPEPPSRLHGDLWGGNAMVGPDGGPVLVDPASYGGHREVDLAMMQLFGGFGPAVVDAYDEVFPLADGHTDRVALYQLHPLLVHAAMFGGGYGRRARATIDRYA
ncbi:fructosamine kinase family protein [Euzebya pacifica]|uniref:fructosamine kinase family protein n=1 Tax=Euzebya pacifica TaxID=1608957 RepID=UPI0030F57ADD